MVSVAPFNAAGDGPRSPPTRGRTQQAGTTGYSLIYGVLKKYEESLPATPKACNVSVKQKK